MTDSIKPGQKGQGLRRKMELFEKNLESRILYHRGVRFRHLAEERLVRQLENEKETLARALDEEKSRLARMSGEWERLKEESAREIGRLDGQCLALEQANALKEQQLSAVMIELKNLRESLAVFQKEKELYEQVKSENQRLKESEMNLARESETLRGSLSGKSRELDAALAKCGLYVQTLSDAGLLTAPADEKAPQLDESLPNDSKAGRLKESLKRFAGWWKEPVAVVELPSFLSKNKTPQ